MTSTKIALLGIVLAAAPALAHHSFSAEFDGSRRIVVTGVITKVDWSNPHTRLFLETTDAAGKRRTYSWQSVPPFGMKRRGLRQEDFKVGEPVTITGFPGKDTRKLSGWAMVVKFQDGDVIRLPMNGRP
jgi:Family of unknown function (DUF6152)